MSDARHPPSLRVRSVTPTRSRTGGMSPMTSGKGGAHGAFAALQMPLHSGRSTRSGSPHGRLSPQQGNVNSPYGSDDGEVAKSVVWKIEAARYESQARKLQGQVDTLVRERDQYRIRMDQVEQELNAEITDLREVLEDTRGRLEVAGERLRDVEVVEKGVRSIYSDMRTRCESAGIAVSRNTSQGGERVGGEGRKGRQGSTGATRSLEDRSTASVLTELTGMVRTLIDSFIDTESQLREFCGARPVTDLTGEDYTLADMRKGSFTAGKVMRKERAVDGDGESDSDGKKEKESGGAGSAGALQADLERMTRDRDAIQKKLNEALETADSDHKHYEEDLETHQDQIASLEAEIASLHEAHHEMLKMMQQKEMQLLRVAELEHERVKDRQKFHDELHRLQAKSTKAQMQYEKEIKSFTKLSAERDQYFSECRQLRENLQSYATDQIHTRYHTAMEKLERLEHQVIDRDKRIHELERSEARARADAEKGKQAAVKWRNKHKETKSEFDDLSDKWEKAQLVGAAGPGMVSYMNTMANGGEIRNRHTISTAVQQIPSLVNHYKKQVAERDATIEQLQARVKRLLIVERRTRVMDKAWQGERERVHAQMAIQQQRIRVLERGEAEGERSRPSTVSTAGRRHTSESSEDESVTDGTFLSKSVPIEHNTKRQQKGRHSDIGGHDDGSDSGVDGEEEVLVVDDDDELGEADETLLDAIESDFATRKRADTLRQREKQREQERLEERVRKFNLKPKSGAVSALSRSISSVSSASRSVTAFTVTGRKKHYYGPSRYHRPRTAIQ